MEYVNLIDRMISSVNCNSGGYDKLFLMRPNSSRQYTCSRVFDILKQQGFVKINPAEYSLKEQIVFFHNAKEIVVEESSMSHNLIFCKPETKVYILRKANSVNEYQMTINSMRNLDVCYVDCNFSVYIPDRYMAAGPFFLYANKLFCDAFRVEYKGFPYGEFRSYLRSGFYFTADVNSYYKTIKWDDEYVLLFTKELEYSRKQYEQKYEWIMKIPFVKSSLLMRIRRWIVKNKMRKIM